MLGNPKANILDLIFPMQVSFRNILSFLNNNCIRKIKSSDNTYCTFNLDYTTGCFRIRIFSIYENINMNHKIVLILSVCVLKIKYLTAIIIIIIIYLMISKQQKHVTLSLLCIGHTRLMYSFH